MRTYKTKFASKSLPVLEKSKKCPTCGRFRSIRLISVDNIDDTGSVKVTIEKIPAYLCTYCETVETTLETDLSTQTQALWLALAFDLTDIAADLAYQVSSAKQELRQIQRLSQPRRRRKIRD